MTSDPYQALGEYLTGSEAAAIAAYLDSGASVDQALLEVRKARRSAAAALIDATDLGARCSVAVLRAIAGAKRAQRSPTTVWTMPGSGAESGRLTGEFRRLVEQARQSVTCATYNFEKSSNMWEVLKSAADQPDVEVTVYVDGDKADAAKVKAQLGAASVYRSGETSDGKQVVSHAKFVVIDHELVLVTSANFSFSAENRNVELGVLLHDEPLARSIEAEMASKQGSLYKRVAA